MTNDYTPEQIKKDEIELPGVVYYILGSTLKYTSLLIGLQSACKYASTNDERDALIEFTGALASYLIGDLLKRKADRIALTRQLSDLEKILKKE